MPLPFQLLLEAAGPVAVVLAGLVEGGWDRIPGSEEEVEEEDGIGDIDNTAVVRVASIQTPGCFSSAQEQVVEKEDRIGDVDATVRVRFSTDEANLEGIVDLR